MDGNRFDQITRRLASGESRRSFLKQSAASLAAVAGLGKVASAGAARRPTPTPIPIRCPGSQVPSGNECVCLSGTKCGPACCEAGSQCCDNACCQGTCYGEELCCPTGQLVCNGACLAPGQCCVDSDCGPDYACSGNQCVCVPSTSCATAGLNCGSFTDDCGGAYDCGTCAQPQSCGGAGVEGVCGCAPSATCDGKCGDIEDGCGGILSCGDCLQCQTCSGGVCVNAENGVGCAKDACTMLSSCIDGVCQGGQPITCPGDSLNQCVETICDPVSGCSSRATNEGLSCDSDPCDPGICRNGSCQSNPKPCNECETCVAGECVPGNDGASCGNGLHCYAGNCCNLPTFNGSIPLDPTVLMACSETDEVCCPAGGPPCCPGSGTCCDMCVIVTDTSSGGEHITCCPEGDQCGDSCCTGFQMCVDHPTKGTYCAERGQVCAGGVVCDTDKCCGGGGGSGVCCGTDSYCIDNACVPAVTASCLSDDDCTSVYGAGSVCNGQTRSFPEGQEVITPGTCCAPGYSRFISFGNGFPQYECCPPNRHPTQYGCCSYPGWECGATTNCSCSRVSIRRWGN